MNVAKTFLVALAVILLVVVVSGLIGYAAFNIISWLGLLAPFIAVITSFVIGLVFAAAGFTAILMKLRNKK